MNLEVHTKRIDMTHGEGGGVRGAGTMADVSQNNKLFEDCPRE